jgi:hypothetical protein
MVVSAGSLLAASVTTHANTFAESNVSRASFRRPRPHANGRERPQRYGKSTELKSVLAQDIARGDGILLLDPAGTLAEEALTLIPPWRHNHVCYFNIADRDFPVGLPTFLKSAAQR